MNELRWWRRRRPDKVTRAEWQTLHRRLIELTPREIAGARSLLRNAAGEDAHAAFRLALLLLAEMPETIVLRDLAASWALLAAHGPGRRGQRSSDAARLLVDLHLHDLGRYRRARGGGRPGPGARMAALRQVAIARAYADIATPALALYRPDLDAAQQADAPSEAAAAETDSPTPPVRWDVPTKKVIRADALPGGQRFDDRQMTKEFTSLLGELPLKGRVADPDAFVDALTASFPWMADALAGLRDDLRLRAFAGQPWLWFRPLLLVGPPGTGKTLLARQLFHRAGVGADLIRAGGASDNRHLQGTARGWSGAQPCGALRAVQRHGCGNPGIVVDEVDKAGGSDRNGRLHDTLLSLLEPVSARAYYDDCLCVELDLSSVCWVLTANTTAGLPAPLRSRLTIVDVPAPDGSAFDAILADLLGEVAGELGLRRATLPPLDPALRQALRADLDRHGDVRRVRRGLTRALARAAARTPRPVDA
jgi:hypothetical protein